MKLIGLYSPYPQMGKNTFADELLSVSPPARTVSFAEWGRETVADLASDFLDGGVEEAIEWMQDSRKDTKAVPRIGVTFRRLLQTVLTDWGRKLIHPDVWVMKAQAEIRRSYKYRAVIVDDLRFENEYAMLRKEGATIIRIERKAAATTQKHESNARLEDMEFDYHVTNNGDVEELQAKARLIAREEGILV